MSEPKYVLHYFDMRARGELIRLIFHYKGIHFHDNRVPFEEWGSFRNEVNGKVLAQSYAISRYLANEFDLTANTNWERAYLDSIVGGIEDVYVRLLPIIYLERDDVIKSEKLSKFFTHTLGNWLESFQRLLVKVDNGQKYLLGNKVTWADLALFEILDLCLSLSPSCLFGFSLLEGYHYRMASLPSLSEYLEERKNRHRVKTPEQK